MLLTKKFKDKMQEIGIEDYQRRKRIKKRKYQRERYHMNTDLNEKLKHSNYLYSMKMSEQPPNFNDTAVSKKEFHASKQAIALNLVELNKIAVSEKFKYSDDDSKYFT